MFLGFEQVVIQCYVYVVEYDVVDFIEFIFNFEFKKLLGFFIVGQFNGISGYEEVVVQGLVVGMVVVWCFFGLDEQVIGWEISYLGVLFDDFVFKGSDEFYCMMISWVEYCLLVCQDNVDECMMFIGYVLGLVDDVELIRVQEKYVWVQSGIKSFSKQCM